MAEATVVQPRIRRRAAMVALMAVLLFFLVPVRADYLKPIIPMEEGSVLVYPERILDGAVPNRDFETMYGPANLWLLSGIYWAAGPTVSIERTVGLAYRLALVLALFFIGKRFGLAAGVSAGVIATAFLAGTWAVAYAWFGGLALATWSLWTVTEKRWAFLGGVLGGLALLFRPDLTLAIAALLLVSRSKRFILGVLAGVSPYMILVVLAGPRAVVEGLVVDPLFRINPGRRFPIPWTSPLLWLVIGSTVVLIGAAVASRRVGRTDLVACAAFAVALLPYAFQRADPFHLVASGCVAVALLPASLAVLLADRRELAVPAACLFVALLGLSTILRGTIESIGQGIGVGDPVSYPLTFGGRTVPLPLETQVAQLSGLLSAATNETRPGDRIFVGPSDLSHTEYNDTFLYYLLPDRTPATYFLEMNPGTADRPGSRLIPDISSAQLLILTTRYDDWSGDGVDRTGARMDAIPGGFCSGPTFGPWRLAVRCTTDMTRGTG